MMKSILHRDFKYVSAAATDIRRTFARVRAEQKRIAAEQVEKVAQIKQRKTK